MPSGTLNEDNTQQNMYITFFSIIIEVYCPFTGSICVLFWLFLCQRGLTSFLADRTNGIYCG